MPDIIQWTPQIKRVAEENDCVFEKVKHKHMYGKIKGEGVCVVLYPHKSTAGNTHIRVRDENSKDPRKAFNVCADLDNLTLGCDFSMKAYSYQTLIGRKRADLINRRMNCRVNGHSLSARKRGFTKRKQAEATRLSGYLGLSNYRTGTEMNKVY